MSDSEDYSGASSSDESESSSSDRAWTCDDIYPTKGGKPTAAEADSSDDDSSSYDSDSSDSFAAGPLAKPSGTAKTVISDSDDDSIDDERVTLTKALPKASAVRPSVQRHSSADIEAVINAQEDVLKKAEAEELKRENLLNMNRESLRQRSEEALSISRHLEEELNNLSEEFDSSDEAMKNFEKQLELKHKNAQPSEARKEQKGKLERRNMEREMRLAKARERIEKKKEEEEKKQQQQRMDESNNAGKLDMSKAARIERAYSWYSRMAMPTREKMKERVEFMPASSGVTPDDVELLPWNARGTFVSVAAMMRMNRTAASTGTKTSSDTDSD